MTTTTTTETIRLDVLPMLIRHGFRWITPSALMGRTARALRTSMLPTGTVVISRTSILDPVAYVWPDGTISACVMLTGSIVDERNCTVVPWDVIPAEKFAHYLDAAGIATRNRRHLTATARIALVREVV